jgi:sugar-specific transcriptional regulator TrmB
MLTFSFRRLALSTPTDDLNAFNEKTEIIYGNENIKNLTLRSFDRIKEKMDTCADSITPVNLVEFEPMFRQFRELKSRGVRLRLITEITKDNISYCKKLSKIEEVRHMDEIKGNFAIMDGKEYRGGARIEAGQHPAVLIRSTMKDFVEQQQYFFETLWSKAIPARERIKEIEEGAKREFVEVIRDSFEIQRLVFDLINKAEEEILVLFSTANAFHRQLRAGTIELLREAVSQRGVKVRILLPFAEDRDNNNSVEIGIEAVEYEPHQLKNIEIMDIRRIKQPIQNKFSMLIVDQSLSLTVELNDDSIETSEEAIGLATYSNSEATVLSYLSIFENLWNQKDGRVQKKQKQAFQEYHFLFVCTVFLSFFSILE